MRVETKYNVDDELWFIMGNRVHCKKVIDVKITVKGKMGYKIATGRGLVPSGKYLHEDTVISYIMESGPAGCFFIDAVKEKDLFKTKKELIKSL